MRAILDHIEELTPTIKTFWFKPETRVRYIAGQFVEVTLLNGSHDSRGSRRWFTLSSSPTEPLLGITTKFMATDGSSFKDTLLHMTIGDQAIFSEPMGDFVLPKDETIPLIFVANGIGATPMRSMTKWLQDTNRHRDITMLYAARAQVDMPFSDFFLSYYGTLLHRTHGARLGVTDILAAIKGKSDSLIYLAGPEPMVEHLGRALEQSGVAKHRIIIDFFLGYPEV